MKTRQVLWILLLISFLTLFSSWSDAKGIKFPSEINTYVGKSFKGLNDPSYQSYDQILRSYLVKRIRQKFGIGLDPKTYSGFDLLEIEALIKCRKSSESADTFLKMFPKHP